MHAFMDGNLTGLLRQLHITSTLHDNNLSIFEWCMDST
jgi:hypothetical protein